jgi:hypothetical protein
LLRKFSLVITLLAICSIPALASVTVNTPASGAKVSTQFPLSATATTCSNQPVSSMGFSLDSSSNTTIVKGTSVNATVTATTGSHALHVKAWGNGGAVCVADVPVTVTTTATTASATTASTSANGVTVSAPGNGATVGSPFTLDASSATCSSQPVSSMGYSLDDSTNTAIVKGTSVAASVTASAGAHTLHVKSWGSSGASCSASVAITVNNASTSAAVSSSSSGASGVAISSPSAGQSVTSPFSLVASGTTCSGAKITSIGYGVDNNSKTVSTGSSLNTKVSAATGNHTIHVTAWNTSGSYCNADVSIDVTSGSSSTAAVSTASQVPSSAKTVSSMQVLSNWQAQHDTGTSGSSSGAMAMVGSPSLSGNARRFSTSFSGNGGELYHVSFADDTSATNFFYDAWVYLSNPSNMGNLEMDMNQVMSNGQTVIYGFQCDGYSGTWDYTKNAGTAKAPKDTWVHSGAACNVRKWSANAWHHVQISYSRTSAGVVTYHSVWLDGAQQNINATVPSAFALGWGQTMLTNFQVDGLGSGSNVVYLDKLAISRW